MNQTSHDSQVTNPGPAARVFTDLAEYGVIALPLLLLDIVIDLPAWVIVLVVWCLRVLELRLTNGRSLAHALFSAYLVSVDGRPLTLTQIITHEYTKLISLTLGFMGFIQARRDPWRRTWHDRMAGTVVVATESETRPVVHLPEVRSRPMFFVPALSMIIVILLGLIGYGINSVKQRAQLTGGRAAEYLSNHELIRAEIGTVEEVRQLRFMQHDGDGFSLQTMDLRVIGSRATVDAFVLMEEIADRWEVRRAEYEAPDGQRHDLMDLTYTDVADNLVGPMLAGNWEKVYRLVTMDPTFRLSAIGQYLWNTTAWLLNEPEPLSTKVLDEWERDIRADAVYDWALKLMQRYPSNRNILLIAANVALSSDEYAAAELRAERLLAVDSLSAPGWLTLGEVYQTLGRLDSASWCYETAVRCDSTLAGAYLFGFRVAIMQWRRQVALERFALATRLRPEWPTAWLTRGQMFLIFGEPENALADFRKALEIQPGWLPALHLTAEVHRQQENYLTAVEYYDSVLTYQPDHVETLIRRAAAYSVVDSLTLAIRDYSRVLYLDPDNKLARELRAVAYKWSGNYTRAIVDYSRLLEDDPNHLIALRGIANVYDRAGREDKALQHYVRYLDKLPPDSVVARRRVRADVFSLLRHLSTRPDSSQPMLQLLLQARACYDRAIAQHDSGAYQKALKTIDEGLALVDDVDHMHSLRGVILSVLGDHEQAAEVFHQAIRLSDSTGSMYHGALGNELDHLGLLDSAVYHYEKALEIFPEDGWTMVALGLMYAEKMQQYDTALVLCDLGVQYMPNFGVNWAARGFVRMKLGLLDKALRDSDQALLLSGESPYVLDTRAMLMEELGREADAAALYRQVLEQSTRDDTDEAVHARERLQALAGS